MARSIQPVDPFPEPAQVDLFPGTHPTPTPSPPPTPPAPTPPVVTPPSAPHIPYGTRVDYRYDDAARLALEHRAKCRITGQQNVAVMVYKDANGDPHTLVIESGEPISDAAKKLAAEVEKKWGRKGHGHTESKLEDFLLLKGIRPDQVVSLFTEREPCSTHPNCSTRLQRMGIGPEKVTYSFEYGPTEESRKRGNAELEETVRALLRGRDGLPFPERQPPRPDDY